MSWSPSETRSLPSLRPDQFFPLAASRGRSTASKSSQLHPSLRKPHESQPRDVREPQSVAKSTSTATKRKETSLSDGLKPIRPSKAPRIPSTSFEEVYGPLPSSTEPGPAPFASAPTTSQPFFSLTKQELATLRRSMGKGSAYTQFRDMTVARELDRLGRGWDGYLRAKDKAEQEGGTEGFWLHFSSEFNTVLSTTHLQPGAIALETAALAAQSNYTSSIGRLRSESAAEIRWLRANLADSGLAGPDSDLCNSRTGRLPSYSPPIPEADSQIRQQESTVPVPISRPKRNLKRPDYRIPPLFESSPESSSSPEVPSRMTTPTPREIYDRTQPRFIQYLCEWNECKASLVNLETLEKHVRVVHAKEAGDALCCRWGHCGTGTPTTYESPEDFSNHFETSHLTPIRWNLGDGQKIHGVTEKAPGV